MRLFGLGLIALVTLLAGCQQQPYRVFAVQVGTAAPPLARVAPVALRAAPGDPDVGELTAKHPQWDLNTASAQTLGQLPGIDSATVQAIIAARPYKDKRELVRRQILTQKQYDTWKSYLVVHRAATATALR